MSDFVSLKKRALQVREKYAGLERAKYGREWTGEELALGFIGDVGDLMKLVAAKEGMRVAEDVDARLGHELADCLWSVLVLAETYGVDLEKEFLKTMDGLEQRIANA